MDTKVNYTVVGVFVIVLSIAFITLFFWLSTRSPTKEYQTYMAYVHEDVTGLAIQSPVRYNGVQVGYVSSIDLDPKNSQLVKLTLYIVGGTPISTSTVATLLPMGITGVIYVGLKALKPRAPALVAGPGEKYPIIPYQPSLLRQVSKVLPELTTNLKNIGDGISKLLSEKNRKLIGRTLENISLLTKNLADNSNRLDNVSKALQETLKNTAIASKQFPDFLDKLTVTLQNLQKTSIQIRGIAHNAKLVMQDGHVTIENVNDQILPSVQQMITKLHSVMTNMQRITAEMDRNPSMFIRGKVPEQPGPGER